MYIDPYVGVKTLAAILRCVANYGQVWEIYMDTKKAKEDEKEIDNASDELKLASFPGLSVYDLHDKLHDRIIILMGEDRSKVFMLSNSLDTLAQKYASAALLVDDMVAKQIADYYAHMIANSDRKVVFTASGRPDIACDEGINDMVGDFVGFPRGTTIPTITSVSSAITVIDTFLGKGIVNIHPYYQRTIIEVASLLSQRSLDDA